MAEAKKVLVTGGAGFIGSYLVERLVADGNRVTVLDNLYSGKEINLQGVRGRVTFILGDIRDREVVSSALAGQEVVFHQAAVASVPRSLDDPILTTDANVTGTVMILDQARRHGVKKVVLASSSSVYGDTPTLPKIESISPSPLSPYALSKLACEHYARLFSELWGTSITCLRYFNVYGPRQDPASQYAAAIPRFITCLKAGTLPTVYGDGEQTRDFTFVTDVVEANLKAAQSRLPFGIYNISGGQRISVNDLVRTLSRYAGVDFAPRYVPRRPGDVLHSLASLEAAAADLGYRPVVPLEEGLRRTWDRFASPASSP